MREVRRDSLWPVGLAAHPSLQCYQPSGAQQTARHRYLPPASRNDVEHSKRCAPDPREETNTIDDCNVEKIGALGQDLMTSPSW